MYRRSKKRGWAAISNALLQDEAMPAGPLALVVYLLSRPDDWEGHASDIERRFGIKTDARRAWTVHAEGQGYLAFRRVRKANGVINQFYEAYDEPLPPEQRTDSRRHLEIAITDEDPPPDNPGVPTPGSPGGPPPDQPVMAEPVMAEPGSAEPGVTNKEKTKKELTKKEGEGEPPLARWRRYEKTFGRDALAAFPECVREAAFELAEYQLCQDKVGCIPHNVPTFLPNAERWAQGLAFWGKGQPRLVEALLRRATAYLAMDRTQRNYSLPTWKMLDEIGIGEKSSGRPTVPLAPPKDPQAVQQELHAQHVERCVESVKADLRRRPKGSLADAVNRQAQYPLDVRTAALRRVMADQAFTDEWEGLKRSGPLKFKTVRG